MVVSLTTTPPYIYFSLSLKQQSNCPAKEGKNKNLVMGPKGVPDTKTDSSTDRRSQHQLKLQLVGILVMGPK
jgi:hypothetical protein